MKNYFFKKLPKSISLITFFVSLISLKVDLLNAEYLLEKSGMDTSTKTDEINSVIPTNPFEIVEMIRRFNSMNDATNPTDALDEALRSFNDLENEK